VKGKGVILSNKPQHERPQTPACGFSHCRNIYDSIFGILCGLCIGQDLLLQRSGIVFVPSIIRLPHSLQMFPVGLALMAYLQAGSLEQE
jgi:hypothetical protein